MARDSKGQRVKTFKHLIPQEDLSTVEETMVVYFKAAEGRFNIFPPEHMVALVSDYSPPGCSVHRFHGETSTRISAPTMDDVVEGFKAYAEKYRDLIKDSAREKVLVFTFKYASRERHQQWGAKEKFGHDTTRPALGIDFEVAWRVGKSLYRWSGDDQPVRARFTTDARVILWTAEREDFFTRMRGALEALVGRLVDFVLALDANPDAAIAMASSQFPALPPPAADHD